MAGLGEIFLAPQRRSLEVELQQQRQDQLLSDQQARQDELRKQQRQELLTDRISAAKASRATTLDKRAYNAELKAQDIGVENKRYERDLESKQAKLAESREYAKGLLSEARTYEEKQQVKKIERENSLLASEIQRDAQLLDDSRKHEEVVRKRTLGDKRIDTKQSQEFQSGETDTAYIRGTIQEANRRIHEGNLRKQSRGEQLSDTFEAREYAELQRKVQRGEKLTDLENQRAYDAGLLGESREYEEGVTKESRTYQQGVTLSERLHKDKVAREARRIKLGDQFEERRYTEKTNLQKIALDEGVPTTGDEDFIELNTKVSASRRVDKTIERLEKLSKFPQDKLSLIGDTLLADGTGIPKEIFARLTKEDPGFAEAKQKILDYAKQKGVGKREKKSTLHQMTAQLVQDYGSLASTDSGKLFIDQITRTVQSTYDRTNQDHRIIADSLGFDPYNLTSEQSTAVLDEITRRAVEKTGLGQEARTTAKYRTELTEKPLSQETLKNAIDPNNMSKFPMGTTLAEAKARGGIAVSETQMTKLSDLDKSENIVRMIDEASSKLITAETATQAALQWAKLYAGAKSRAHAGATGYEALREQFTGVLARDLSGESGVLTEGDADRVTKGMPNFRDTIAVKKLKMGVLYSVLEVARRAQRMVILGRADRDTMREFVKQTIENKMGGLTEPVYKKNAQGIWKKVEVK